LKLNLTYLEFCSIVDGSIISGSSEGVIKQIIYDSRRSKKEEGSVFIALPGNYRDGHTFIGEAHAKGVTCFVVSKVPTSYCEDATYILVDDTLKALQKLAKSHREKFSYPIIAIAGSIGKTTIKEWLYHFLGSKYRVIRSPKSYNSQLGVAISLLNLHEDCDFALIEAGISRMGEMIILEEMIRPEYGVLTSLTLSHKDQFKSESELIGEQLILFKNKKTIVSSALKLSISELNSINGNQIIDSEFSKDLLDFPYLDKGSIQSGLIAMAVAKTFSCLTTEGVHNLPRLAMRLETFEGIDNSIIINDTYNLDLDALVYSLEYQLAISKNKKRIVIVGLDAQHLKLEKVVQEKIAAFNPDEIYFSNSGKIHDVNLKDAVVLIKGTRAAEMEKLATKFKLKNHKTVLEINLTALKHNISVFKGLLLPTTKLLAMVKAQSYGAGLEKIGLFLQNIGVDRLGVAYSDEGAELRKAGVTIPILVMNPEEAGFETCIKYQLEPAIYSFEQLNNLVNELMIASIQDFNIHIKIDTGMHRLGFNSNEVSRLREYIQAQPEVKIASVYSHLADADNRKDKYFSEHQIALFESACKEISKHSPTFYTHILNSEGIVNFSSAQLEMVRIGIGMYGISGDTNLAKKLLPVLKWRSVISQIKVIYKGDSVGYSRAFVAEKKYTIAIIPLGYADGFKRSMGNGNGGVYIHGTYCATVGRVSMDMIMVDITTINAKEGDEVEIIGQNQTLEKLAKKMDTIPYEIMTSISTRVHRIYVEE
jgi:Alr-MurF fusion protein